MSEKTLALIGRSGNGITSIRKSILAKDKSYKTLPFHFNVIELKSIEDSDVEDTKAFVENVSRAVKEQDKHGGIDAFVFVLKYGVRFTKQEKDAVRLVKKCFGEDVLKQWGIIAFSYGDNFRMDNDLRIHDTDACFRDWCRKQIGDIKNLFDEVNYRCVLFDNKTEHYEKESLFNEVALVLKKNNNLKYTTFKPRIQLVNQLESVELQNQLTLAATSSDKENEGDKGMKQEKRYKMEKKPFKKTYLDAKKKLKDQHKKSLKQLKEDYKKQKKELKSKIFQKHGNKIIK